MEYTPISSLLQKFKNILAPNDSEREAFVKAVKEVCGFSITKKEVLCRNGIFHLKASPVCKSEIFLRKHDIVRAVKEMCGPNAPSDIR
ncbi:MAG: hypothetical protein A2836_00770 [Candidatus Taylorbacteria bacterium RIFCSPHIGHO2_01_FULL_45_63]|uniref:Uncharacterized protein n=1 Tax=Candidatus Taylorbacteria bacterium RIFCSPHIGHO2_02_FULL_45_35 TaxID=1802311 RepID=A0A1G2MW06_9BACT|nr:MAG: hypothetical protein A2836_00770 [Candidatus Taylorbacteria bacterium RIFCSPHIGHO2_01_FULL_45_63]OHA27151.1 MAG: hypothetical protein A3D56_03470 [Candidatus Taylorbacteria bacterium RIFCSPHIGHO2_02_FULL_45_35]OHA33851.1 MAG: hypothetical protein A3A22_01445 [Candidatus Taylorbacteria bacterium RIFCSPLOWO2_01_FULL_45_34b]